MYLGQRGGATRLRAGTVLGAAFLWIACCLQSRADGLSYLETADLRIVNFAPAGDYLVPYAGGATRWPYAQVTPFEWEPFARLLDRAAVVWTSDGYRALAARLRAGDGTSPASTR